MEEIYEKFIFKNHESSKITKKLRNREQLILKNPHKI